MGDRNRRKSNKSRICNCCPELLGNEEAIICNSCGKSSHANCVGLNKVGIEFSNVSEVPMWFTRAYLILKANTKKMQEPSMAWTAE